MSKEILSKVISKQDIEELWGTSFRTALPFLPQSFSIGGILPAVLYMMRWGHRRGRGAFPKKATIAEVSQKLLQHEKSKDWFDGFTGEAETNIFGDLLLAYCLENKHHNSGRTEQVQRVFPTHYFSSWIDLPEKIADLRNVPESIAAIFSRQNEGKELSRKKGQGFFVVGDDLEKNLLLKVFSFGTRIQGDPTNLKSDIFDENVPVGIDQLLTIRIALSLGAAPEKARGENPNIPNQYPVATLAADHFFEDFKIFLRAYHSSIPRQALLQMLESCLSVGLTTMYLSTLKNCLEWAKTGQLTNKHSQTPWPSFVDCSVSMDKRLQGYSEECFDDVLNRMYRLPVYFMTMKVLEMHVRADRLKAPSSIPDPTERINYLGALMNGALDESRDCYRDLRKLCNKLSDVLLEPEEFHIKRILDNDEIHPAWRIAEAVVVMMGDRVQGVHFRKALDSCLMMNEPNGLGRKRRTRPKGKMLDRRSIVLTNTVLDFLVHRHLRKAGKGTKGRSLSLVQFIRTIKDRYGFYVDEAPPGLSIPDDQLRKNRDFLERRLRDLGLLRGVNDAEEMKLLCQRFEVENDKE